MIKENGKGFDRERELNWSEGIANIEHWPVKSIKKARKDWKRPDQKLEGLLLCQDHVLGEKLLDSLIIHNLEFPDSH